MCDNIVTGTTLMPKKPQTIKKYNYKDQLDIEDDADNWFNSFMEILASIIKVLMVAGCLLIVKSLFDLAIDMFNNVEYQNSEVMKIEIIAVTVLGALGLIAFWVISRDN